MASKKGFAIKPTRQIKEFFWTVTIQQFGYGLVNIFEPIYLYELGVPLWGIAAYQLAVYIPYLFTLPLGGKFAKRFGYEHALAVGTFFNAAYIAVLAGIQWAPWLLFVAPFVLTLQKTFWWPAYHANFARFSRRGELGQEIGIVQGFYTLATGIGPFIGGFLIVYTGFDVLFAISVIVLIMSVIPLFTTREKFVPSVLSYREMFSILFSREHRRRLIGSLGFGADLLGVTLWPLYIFLTLGSTATLGIVAGVTTLAATLGTFITGRLSDRYSSKRVFIGTVVVQSLAWLFRPLANSFGPIQATDAAGLAGANSMYVPYYAKSYQHAQQHHVMVEVVGVEMALVVGKVLMAGFMLVLLQYTTDLPLLFMSGFAVTLFYFFLR